MSLKHTAFEGEEISSTLHRRVLTSQVHSDFLPARAAGSEVARR